MESSTPAQTDWPLTIILLGTVCTMFAFGLFMRPKVPKAVREHWYDRLLRTTPRDGASERYVSEKSY